MRPLVALLWAVVVVPAQAATWYAAATGTDTNGSYALPWSIPYAVGKTANPHLQPGDLVNLFPGTYVCVDTNTTHQLAPILDFKISGTAANKITYQSLTPWTASFDGGLVLHTASNLVLQFLRVYYSGSTQRWTTNALTHPPGISEYTPGNHLLHNLVENCGHPGIASWRTTHGKYIAGNIIRFTGDNDFTPGHSGENRGSAMYLQNEDDTSIARIEGNISYFNHTTGMKAYGNTDIWGFKFGSNICTLNKEAGIFYNQDDYASVGVDMKNNYMWVNLVGARVGYPGGSGGSSNTVVTGNYIVEQGAEPLYQVGGWFRNTWTNNVAVRLPTTPISVFFLEDNVETNRDDASHTIDHNTYYSPGSGSGQFIIGQVNKTFAAWKAAVLGDSNSTVTVGLPTSLNVFTFRPSTLTNYTHVAVFNWATNATTTVDLSSYVAPGNRVTIYDAQELPVSYTNQLYAGGSITLDLLRTNRAAMLGEFTNYTGTNAWSGFDTRFRAFVIAQEATREIRATTANVGTIQVAP